MKYGCGQIIGNLQQKNLWSYRLDTFKIFSHNVFLSSRPHYVVTPKMMKTIPDEELEELFLEQMKSFHKEKVKTIFVLMTKDHMRLYYPFDLISRYKKEGFKVVFYPIQDYSVPYDIESFYKLIEYMNGIVKRENILIHCNAGLGRTGLVASALLIFNSVEYKRAINYIRKIRSGSVETKEQVLFLKEFEEYILKK